MWLQYLSKSGSKAATVFCPGMIFTDLPFNIKKTIDIIYCAQYNYAKDKQRGDR